MKKYKYLGYSKVGCEGVFILILWWYDGWWFRVSKDYLSRFIYIYYNIDGECGKKKLGVGSFSLYLSIGYF